MLDDTAGFNDNRLGRYFKRNNRDRYSGIQACQSSCCLIAATKAEALRVRHAPQDFLRHALKWLNQLIKSSLIGMRKAANGINRCPYPTSSPKILTCLAPSTSRLPKVLSA